MSMRARNTLISCKVGRPADDAGRAARPVRSPWTKSYGRSACRREQRVSWMRDYLPPDRRAAVPSRLGIRTPRTASLAWLCVLFLHPTNTVFCRIGRAWVAGSSRRSRGVRAPTALRPPTTSGTVPLPQAAAYTGRGRHAERRGEVPSWLRLVRSRRPLSSTPSDTELVPLWVGEHHPPGPVIPTPVVQHHRAQIDRALDLLVSLGRGRPQIKMETVLRRLPLRDTQKQQAQLTRGRHDQDRVVLGHVAGPDLALEQRAPEHGERVRVARVEGELVNLQRSIFAVCHGFQPTTRGVHCRSEISPPMLRVLHGLSAHARRACDALGRRRLVRRSAHLSPRTRRSARYAPPQVHDREPTQVIHHHPPTP